MKHGPMVRTWFADEIEATLRSVALANRDVADAIQTPEMALYQRGFDAALASLAAAFQVDAPERPAQVTRR